MRVPKLGIALPFIVLTAFLGGCATYSVHPFYKPDESTLEPGLVGTWTVDKAKITIQANEEGTYEVRVADSDSNGDYRYKMRLIRVGGDLFADAVFDEEYVNDKKIDFPYGIAAFHFLYKVLLNGDTLRISLVNHDWLVTQIEAKKISIAHEYMDENLAPRDSSILLTASSANLQKFIQQLADTPDAFEEPDILNRQK
ncbi:MAG: hypothetical protein ABSF68_09225 [Candidatus Acidiferrales bacterium]